MTSAVEERPNISIIIVSYNVRDLLESCLHSVASAVMGVSHEIFVVDNNSDDGTVEMLRLRFPDVTLFANNENLGFAKANNIALQQARGEYLLLLNPDTLVQEDTVQYMLRFFEENGDVGMAGCKIIKPDGTLEAACRRSFPSPWVSFTKMTGLSSLFPRSRMFARYNLTYLCEDESYEVDAISGSFMMLRREVYDEIGGLDESYFMYGEDLDWCFRTQQAGWKLFYVHGTKIIHYGGESTKRSSIDATAEFYRAMQLFAKNNLKLSPLSRGAISLGIRLRLMFSRSRHLVARLWPVLADALTMVLALGAAETMRMGALFILPDYAYPTVYIVSVLVLLASLFACGVYTRQQYGIVRSGLGVLLSFLILSSLTYFFKEWGFSRAIMLIASTLNLLLIPGRRIMSALLNPRQRINPVTGRRTLLVGLNDQSLDVLRRLKLLDGRTCTIVGLIDVTRKRLGENIEGVSVIGSVENIGKVIQENDISDVILGPDVCSYADILSMIGRTRSLPVHFRIVPRSMEFVIGKTSVDPLGNIPLVDVNYSLMKPSNRALKRVLDVVASLPAVVLVYPFVALGSRTRNATQFNRFIMGLPSVLSGRRSLVGYDERHEYALPPSWPGKPGLTGLTQLRGNRDLTHEEIVGSVLQYVRDYSVFLDLEILIRTFIQFASNKRTRI